MATDLTLYLNDQPGELARLGESWVGRGPTSRGLCAVASGGGQAEVHILVERRDVGVRSAQGRRNQDRSRAGGVGAWKSRIGRARSGEIAHELGAARVNLTLVYIATNTRSYWRGQSRRREIRRQLSANWCGLRSA